MKVIMFDADNTLYRIKNKELLYDLLLENISNRIKEPLDRLRERFFNILETLKISSDPNIRSREYLLMKLGLDYDTSKEIVKDFYDNLLNNLELVKGVVDFLDMFYKRGYILIIFTDEYKKYLKMKLRFLGIESYFYGFITPEDVGTMKPSKEYYLYVEKMGFSLSEIVLVIGDNYEKDLALAKELGLRTAHLTLDKQCRADVCFVDYYDLIRKVNL